MSVLKILVSNQFEFLITSLLEIHNFDMLEKYFMDPELDLVHVKIRNDQIGTKKIDKEKLQTLFLI